MKKSISVFWMLTALTGAIVFGTLLAGCYGMEDDILLDSGDDPVKREVTQAAASLAKELGEDKATFSGSTVTLTDDVTLDKDIEVKEGVTLDVAADKKLEVRAGATLTVAGTIKVKSGGTLVSPGNGEIAFDTNGSVVLEKGADNYYGEDPLISNDIDNYPVYKWDEDTPADSTITLTDRATTLKGKVTAIKNTTVADKTTIAIEKNSTLTIDTDVTFTVEGTLNVEAKGKLDVKGDFVTGTIADGTNNGNIFIRDGGKTYSKNTKQHYDGTGYTVVEKGGKAYQTVSIGDENTIYWPMIGVEDEDTLTIGGVDFPPAIVIARGRVSFNNTSYVLDGTATLNGAFDEKYPDKLYFGISGTQLKLKKDSELTIPCNTHVSIYHITKNTNPPIVGDTGAKIIIKDGALVYFFNDDNIGNARFPDNPSTLPNFNFYEAPSEKVSTNGLSDATFTWDPALGDNKGGWKADS
jgi:hypothetical protein